MRFRRSFRTRMRPFREPRVWSRTSTNAANAAGTVVGEQAFSPDILTAGTTDQRLTLLRLHLSGLWLQVAAPSNGSSSIYYGVYLADIAAASLNPFLLSATDKQADWLHLGCIERGSINATSLTGPDGYLWSVDVKSKRKVEENQSIVFGWSVMNPTTGAIDAAGRYSFVGTISALYQRTSR